MTKPVDFALPSHLDRLHDELSMVIRSGGSTEEIDRLIDAMSEAHRASLAAGGQERASAKEDAVPVAVADSEHAL